MRRFTSAILVLAFLAIGAGVVRAAHDAVHAADDAARSEHGLPVERQHDETNCFIHALIGSPMLSASAVPLLIAAGLLVAFLTLVASVWTDTRPSLALDCRGPPARS